MSDYVSIEDADKVFDGLLSFDQVEFIRKHLNVLDGEIVEDACGAVKEFGEKNLLCCIDDDKLVEYITRETLLYQKVIDSVDRNVILKRLNIEPSSVVEMPKPKVAPNALF